MTAVTATRAGSEHAVRRGRYGNFALFRVTAEAGRSHLRRSLPAPLFGRLIARVLRPRSRDLLRQPIDVFVANTPTAFAAKAAVTTTVSIVFAGGGDPVRNDLVVSLSRPRGNVTGVFEAPHPQRSP